ncbi:hypothetical protein GOP47_0008798 [Adiantum capillus-veneris]|uniref:Uncharacterized protein n=1 Tax=Adiantum capillus-veneris TaxID=13818 RepID=A0A9D4ZID4_ADICA|nr:hypothetical protein GOP47_0008798 [Adiantum capillus-veneris]
MDNITRIAWQSHPRLCAGKVETHELRASSVLHVYAKSLRGDEKIREEELRRADKRRKRYRASVGEQEVLVTELQKQPLALAWLTANTPLGSTSTVAQVIYH